MEKFTFCQFLQYAKWKIKISTFSTNKCIIFIIRHIMSCVLRKYFPYAFKYTINETTYSQFLLFSETLFYQWIETLSVLSELQSLLWLSISISFLPLVAKIGLCNFKISKPSLCRLYHWQMNKILLQVHKNDGELMRRSWNEKTPAPFNF